jgi:membrane protein
MATERKSSRVPLRGWLGILRRVRDDFGQDQVALVAGGVAFYWLLAGFPALGTAVSLGALVAEPAVITNTLSTYGDLLPPEILELLRRRIDDLALAQDDALTASTALWFVTSLWVAMAGIRGIISGINVAWDLQENRGWISSTVIAFALMALGLGVLIVAALFFAALPIMKQLSGLDAAEQVLWIARWPLLAVAMMSYLSVMYRVAPCRRAPRRAWITPGAVVATLLFLVASAGFSVYVQTYAAYNDTYGSLSNGVVLLLWFWLSAISVLVGAELDAEIERTVASSQAATAEARSKARG